MSLFPFALAIIYTKTTTTTTMELIRASDNETDDQEDSDDEDILALIAALVASDYGGRYLVVLRHWVERPRSKSFFLKHIHDASKKYYECYLILLRNLHHSVDLILVSTLVVIFQLSKS